MGSTSPDQLPAITSTAAPIPAALQPPATAPDPIDSTPALSGATAASGPPSGGFSFAAVSAEQPSPAPSPIATDQSDQRPETTRPADTDAQGNWIPPNLRGMAAPAANGSDLPKRRRSQD